MSGALLDTSILIAAEASLDDLPASAAISVVTLGELYAGVHLARTAEIRRLRRRRLDATRAAFSPLPVDDSVAKHYGEVLAVARRDNRSAKATDVLIIATAAASSRSLHTLDASQAQLARAAEVTVA
ncbi:MAG: PIN domain-containing protein [Actinomycetota bacterium]|nr:PIN domain-containing protein [Actinomycetota bacterium]